jgi:hypothetical protein
MYHEPGWEQAAVRPWDADLVAKIEGEAGASPERGPSALMARQTPGGLSPRSGPH